MPVRGGIPRVENRLAGLFRWVSVTRVPGVPTTGIASHCPCLFPVFAVFPHLVHVPAKLSTTDLEPYQRQVEDATNHATAVASTGRKQASSTRSRLRSAERR